MRFFLSSTVVAVLLASFNLGFASNFAIVIDAGSTGSRCFVFQVSKSSTGTRVFKVTNTGKVRPGLSTFAGNASAAASYIEPLLTKACEVIPSRYHETTKVFIKGTAGMRLIDKAAQEEIWNALRADLNSAHNIPFHIKSENFGTINGHMEAYYAVLASNYIEGSIDGDLRPVPGVSMVGALDMGGGSTQLIFYDHVPGSTETVTEEHFWSHSWLNYGVETIRERVYNYLHDSFQPPVRDHHDDPGIMVPNPCGFKGNVFDFPETAKDWGDKLSLLGTGNATQCVETIKSVVWPSINCAETGPCTIDGVRHPPLSGHHFYAMSVYFYAMDCIHHVGDVELPSWPNPSIAEMKEAASRFCELEWEDVLTRMQTNKHPYTRTYQIANRCIEGLYLVTLLEQGFGFHPDSRSITIALEVNGSEVEWTLGYALAEIRFDSDPDAAPPPPPTEEMVQLVDQEEEQQQEQQEQQQEQQEQQQEQQQQQSIEVSIGGTAVASSVGEGKD